MQIKKEPIQKGAKLLKDALADTKEAGLLAAKAIMTTDTVPKEAAASFEVDGVIRNSWWHEQRFRYDSSEYGNDA